MDTDQIYQHARARFEHASARRALKEKYEAKMLFAHAGGMWRAGPELQIILSSCAGSEMVLLDLYETPIRVDTRELLSMSHERWQEQMNAWLVEYQDLTRNR